MTELTYPVAMRVQATAIPVHSSARPQPDLSVPISYPYVTALPTLPVPIHEICSMVNSIAEIHFLGVLPMLNTAIGPVIAFPWIWFRWCGGCPFQIHCGLPIHCNFLLNPLPENVVVFELMWLDWEWQPLWNQKFEVAKAAATNSIVEAPNSAVLPDLTESPACFEAL